MLFRSLRALCCKNRGSKLPPLLRSDKAKAISLATSAGCRTSLLPTRSTGRGTELLFPDIRWMRVQTSDSEERRFRPVTYLRQESRFASLTTRLANALAFLKAIKAQGSPGGGRASSADGRLGRGSSHPRVHFRGTGTTPGAGERS